MTLAQSDLWDEIPLPFTTPCKTTGNFPGEYSETLRWKCDRLDGHRGTCTPRETDRRRHSHRLAIRERQQVPDEVHLDAEMLRHVVGIAVRECDDSGVMWLLIRQYICFVNFLRLVCPTSRSDS